MDILRRFLKIISILFFSIFIFSGRNSMAQLSPGDLSNAHAFLDGVENCRKCHGADQNLAPDKCLSCHTFLAERNKTGLGLHASAAFSDCGTCHVEHQGRAYDLVFWKDGQNNFDHALTDYKLEGKHTSLECRKCHQAKNIVIKDRLLAQKKNLDRTFWGLNRECLSCHADEHRGQLAQTCLDCHSMAGWKPPVNFSHDKAKFVLTGRHISVDCDKCHPVIVDNRSVEDKDYLKFTNLTFQNCLDCHKDTHDNKFGQNCEGCHNTSGWQNVSRGQFDHSKTLYPLEGQHISVDCAKCHAQGKSFKGLQFDRCQACHSDFHQGQFAGRESKGACEECHTVTGYEPAKFTIEQHQTTRYPLTGSHLAVPCIACHKEEGTGKTQSIQFKFENMHCYGCHNDPHEGRLDKFISASGCESCHIVETWHKANYDHSQTKLPLEGKHKDIACAACHSIDKGGKLSLEFTGLPLQCQGCHQDIHHGQFAGQLDKTSGSSQTDTDCNRCHTSGDWQPAKFDHNRDSSFKLDGAHLKVACVACHKEITGVDRPYRLFKPLETSCSSCHGDGRSKDGGGKS
jgi:hypothetical protein